MKQASHLAWPSKTSVTFGEMAAVCRRSAIHEAAVRATLTENNERVQDLC